MDFQNKHQPYQSNPNEGLRLITYCPLCNTHYNPLSAKVLDENTEAHLIHINCNQCGSSIIALVLTGGMGISSVGLITDLTPDDVMRFKAAEVVDHNEVLSLYEALESGADIINELLG